VRLPIQESVSEIVMNKHCRLNPTNGVGPSRQHLNDPPTPRLCESPAGRLGYFQILPVTVAKAGLETSPTIRLGDSGALAAFSCSLETSTLLKVADVTVSFGGPAMAAGVDLRLIVCSGTFMIAGR
jgi:hypothetical protein